MCFLINTTFAIDSGVKEGFLCWLHQCFIPAVKDNGAADVVASRVIGQMLDGPLPDDETEAYACQFQVKSREAAAKLADCISGYIIPECRASWADRVLPFTTFMEILEK